MATKQKLNKIESFVKDQVTATKSSIVIIENKKGYKVNNLNVLPKDSVWLIIDPAGKEISSFNSARMAILSAALHVKKKMNHIQFTQFYDRQLLNLKHDKMLFESKISNNFRTEIYEDRLSRTLTDLDLLNSQISELEKSVGLQ
jgi:hypothetical protein